MTKQEKKKERRQRREENQGREIGKKSDFGLGVVSIDTGGREVDLSL